MFMRYLIDGYNLLHATGHLSGKVGPQGLEKARLALLSHLAVFARTEAVVTVVFDARNAPRSVAAEQDYQGVSVRYALDGEADDLIEELIRQDAAPRSLTVVSDDRRLKEAARRRDCPMQGCLDFYETAGQTPRTPPAAATMRGPGKLSEQEVQAWLEAFGTDSDD